MPHMTKASPIRAELLRVGAYSRLGQVSRVVNGRTYLQLENGNSLYVGPGAFYSEEEETVLLVYEGADHGYYHLAEGIDKPTATAMIADFLAAHGVDETTLRARDVQLPPGWTADP
jgi:hypothetical protein